MIRDPRWQIEVNLSPPGYHFGMVRSTPAVFAILESFLREEFSDRYDPEELEELIEKAKAIVRQRIDTEHVTGGEQINEPAAPAEHEEDLEERLRRSLQMREEEE